MIKTIESIKRPLISWYATNKRELPWRASRDPYRIWISEVMLQQTTVAVVIPYFERFTAAFPDVAALARAPESKVLSLWSGLGYYSRARNLHKAAKAIAAIGKFPSTSGELLNLPGIGPYTAAAVASIAFDESVACVDGNVTRVVSRLFDVSEDVGSKSGAEKIKTLSASLISGQPPSQHNQAMMELGATICTPKNPTCRLCPVMLSCQARMANTVAERPVKKKKRKQEPWIWEMHLIERCGKIAFVKSDNGTPWLKNTWVLPGTAKKWTKSTRPESTARHSITHHKIFVRLKKVSKLPRLQGEIKWVSPREISKLGVSSVVQKVLKDRYTL